MEQLENQSKELEGEFIPLGQQKELLFKSYQEALTHLSWVKPRAVQLNTGHDNFGNDIVQLIYVR